MSLEAGRPIFSTRICSAASVGSPIALYFIFTSSNSTPDSLHSAHTFAMLQRSMLSVRHLSLTRSRRS